MKLTMEMPANGQTLTEIDHKVVGLPPEEHKRFWGIEDKFNSRFIRAMNTYIVFNWLVFGVQLFLIPFDVNLLIYILVQAVQIANGNFFEWNFFHSIYTLNVFFIECMWFLSKKFQHLSKKIRSLRATKTKLVYNQELAKLIKDYNEVVAELTDINDFFKNFLGNNLIHFGLICVFVTFITLFVDLRLKLSLNFMYFVCYLVVIFIPFRFGNNIRREVA